MPKQIQEKSIAKKSLGIKPLMGYLLVEPLTPETKTASGILLPDSAQERPAQGTVLAIGADIVMPSGQVILSQVQVGDKVVHKKWGGDEIKIAGTEYKLVKFEDLMAILEG